MNKQPVIVAHGVGRDSTALIIEMQRRGIRPDAILFANVGSEKRATYEFIPVFNEWLRAHDFPTITVVRYEPVSAPYFSLEGNMILNATMPGAVFGRSSCTMKMKVAPQEKWTRRWAPAQEAWAAGQKVARLIGFECGEEYRMKRADTKAHGGRYSDSDKYEYHYPLIEWNIDLGECINIIQGAGLPVPPKSACYFCPNQQPGEVHELTDEDRARIILIELTAEPYNEKVHGLWRRPRKADGRPGSITEYILKEGLTFTPLTSIASKIVLNPACKKAATGTTFNPPHNRLSLRAQLVAHAMPCLKSSPAATGMSRAFTWKTCARPRPKSKTPCMRPWPLDFTLALFYAYV
jgi:hypothetical protein